MEKNPSPDPPFISHYAIIQGEMGLFLTFSVFERQRGYLYQNGVEFRQKVIGAGTPMKIASAPIAEHAIFKNFIQAHICTCYLENLYAASIVIDPKTHWMILYLFASKISKPLHVSFK